MPHPVNLEELSSVTGLTVYHKGPPLSVGPLPTFFYFSLSAEESFTLDPFNQPIQFLEDLSNIRLFSITIPGHEPGLDKHKAMEFWARAITANDDFITPFIDGCVHEILALIDQGYIDKQQLAVGGLSRGGYIALHLAARLPEITLVLVYAPLIDLADLDEFKELKEHPMTQSLKVENLIPHLIKKQISIYMGNRDTRVNTDHVYQFVRSFTEVAYQSGIRSPTIELKLSPSIGYRGHGTPSPIFKAGIEWLKEKL